MTVVRPDGTESAPIAVPLEAARPPARRTRLVIGGWLLGLIAVIALGVSGHEPAAPAPIAPEAAALTIPGTPSPPATPAPTIRASATHGFSLRPVTAHRSLGNDGLIGGIAFGTNVREPETQAKASPRRPGAVPGGAGRPSHGVPRSSS